MLGPGWLVQLAVDHDKRLEYRFEPDGGQPITTPADAAAELAGLRALLADVRHLGHVGCASCSAMATQVVQSEPHASDLWKGAQQITFRRYCDAHAPPEATPLPWAGVVGKAGK
jgi:hypothetical protein